MTNKLKNGGMARLVAILLTLAWVSCMLWASDTQMRESDQASLLTGAVELGRGDASGFGNESYNYDKQYLSYWFVAGVLRMVGAVGSDATIERVVGVSNLAAVILFSGALLWVVVAQREWSWAKLVLLASVLFSPVVAFTGMLLSPNLISGAFVLLLVAVLGRGNQPCVLNSAPGDGPERRLSVGGPGGVSRGLWIALVFLLSLAAVAARQDAVLLMPLLVFLAVGKITWRSILGSPVPWALGAGCVLALVVGRLIDPAPTRLPAPFFAAPTFVVYLAGGLGGALLAILVLAGSLLWSRRWKGVLLCCAVLVPLVFYACFLYTPRHLFVVAIGLLAVALVPTGSGVWSGWASGRWGRIVLAGVTLLTLVPWCVGVRMHDWTEGRVVARDSTLYPTADGFWPMGAYGSFFLRLAAAGRDPVDHNQEVWAAWAALDAGLLPPGKGAIVSSGLTSFGLFALSWHGRDVAEEAGAADYVLFDDRTIAKRQLGVDRTDLPQREQVGSLLRSGQSEVIGRAFGRSIVTWTARGNASSTVDEKISLRAGLAQVYGGNDFRFGSWRGSDWKRRWWDGHQILFAVRSAEKLDVVSRSLGESLTVAECRSGYDAEPWHVVEISGSELSRVVADGGVDGEGLWIACGMLPAFMDVRSYDGSR